MKIIRMKLIKLSEDRRINYWSNEKVIVNPLGLINQI